MIEWILYYDSRYIKDTVREMLEIARNIPYIRIVDTANMSSEERDRIYFDIIVPISVFARKKVRGHVRTHKAGAVTFIEGVLVKNEQNPRKGGILIGKEALEILKKFAKTNQEF